MKDKTKNILKGLGIGALTCFGIFTLTGCRADLTQENIEKIMYTIDSSDMFMQDTIDLLEKLNTKLTKEEAWDLYKLAQTRTLLNDDGIRNNLKLTITSDLEEQNGTVYLYQTELEGYVSVFETEFGCMVMYDEDDVVYEYNGIDLPSSKVVLGDGSAEEYVSVEAFDYSLMCGCEEDTIVDCKRLSNGNYLITFVSETSKASSEYLNLVKIEISSDARFVSQKISTRLIHEGSYRAEVDTQYTVKYEYGVVTYDDVEEPLETAIDKSITE